MANIVDLEEECVAAREDDAKGGERDMVEFHHAGVEVSLNVIDADEWFLPGDRETFGGIHADEESSDEARSFSDGDEVDLGGGDVGFLHRFVDDRNDRIDVAAAGKFWENAAVALMDVS